MVLKHRSRYSRNWLIGHFTRISIDNDQDNEMDRLMRSFFRSSVFALSVMTGGVAVADSSPVVIELYTSQGCSSCPPADAMLAELSQRDDVIALALHVDYWDYIGWADGFADPAHTLRQQGYAHAAGDTTIYTPQMVIGGVDHVIGARAMQVADLVQAHRAVDYGVSVSLTRNGDAVVIEASSTAQNGPLVVQIAHVMPVQTVDIRRGENAGKTIDYANVVSKIEVVGEWDGVGDLSLEAQAPASDAVVVIIQQGTNGPIVAAAELG